MESLIQPGHICPKGNRGKHKEPIHYFSICINVQQKPHFYYYYQITIQTSRSWWNQTTSLGCLLTMLLLLVAAASVILGSRRVGSNRPLARICIKTKLVTAFGRRPIYLYIHLSVSASLASTVAVCCHRQEYTLCILSRGRKTPWSSRCVARYTMFKHTWKRETREMWVCHEGVQFSSRPVRTGSGSKVAHVRKYLVLCVRIYYFFWAALFFLPVLFVELAATHKSPRFTVCLSANMNTDVNFCVFKTHQTRNAAYEESYLGLCIIIRCVVLSQCWLKGLYKWSWARTNMSVCLLLSSILYVWAVCM